jgi:hypothetical protein
MYDAIMPTAEIGPVGRQVAESIRWGRRRAHMSVRALAQRLADLGRPTQPSAITKTEHGERRVDVDDLVAFAQALASSPSQLLLGPPDEGLPRRGLDEALGHEQAAVVSPILRAIFEAVFPERDREAVDPRWLLHVIEEELLAARVLQLSALQRGEPFSPDEFADKFAGLPLPLREDTKGGNRGEHRQES